MRIIVTDKVARRRAILTPMFEIEMPCCGATTHLEDLTDAVDCEACGVVLELDPPLRESLSVAA